MESDYEVTLKRLARLVGLGILLISAYFSYDGFNQEVGDGNTGYTMLATIIGIAMCISISIIQFVLSSRYDQLNLTLKVIGFASYVYSIWTNYLGAVHIMEMSTEIAIAVAFFFDVVPEPLISWSFGDAMKGDVFGNIVKMVLGTGGKPKVAPPPQNPSKPFSKPAGGGGGQYRPISTESRPGKPEFHSKFPKR